MSTSLRSAAGGGDVRKCFLILVLLTGVGLSGCAHVEVIEKAIDRPIGSYQATSSPKGHVTYQANCNEASPLKLFCTFTKEDRCDQSTIEAFEHIVMIEKSTAWWVKMLEWTAAGGLLAAGVAMTVDAGYIPDNDPFHDNPVGKTGAYAIGGSLLGAGVGAASLAIIDSIRAIDEVDEIERMEKVQSVVEVPCKKHTLAHQVISVENGKKRIEIETDESGSAMIELASVIGEEAVLREKTEPVIAFYEGDEVMARVRVDQYFKYIQDKERARLEELARQKEEIRQINQEIARLSDDNDGRRCLDYFDKYPDILKNAPIYQRVDELRLCAADALANEAEVHFKKNNLAAGTPALMRLERLVPDHKALSRLKADRQQAFLGLTTELLRNWRIEKARSLANHCSEIILSQKVCQLARKKVETADLLMTVAAFEKKGIKGGLVAIGEDSQSRIEVRKISKRVVLRSGVLRNLEWIKPSLIEEFLSPDDPEWQKQCLSEEDCTVGLFKQTKANFLMGLALRRAGAGHELVISLIQPVGATLEKTQTTFSGNWKTIQKKAWNKIKPLLLKAKEKAEQSRKLYLASKSGKPNDSLTAAVPVIEEPIETRGKPLRRTTEPEKKKTRSPYPDIDMTALFATPEDVYPPPNCVNLFEERPARSAGGGVFKRPQVLLLDLHRAGGNYQMEDPYLANQGLERTLLNTFRMKRNDYIVPCGKVGLDDVQNKYLPGVEFVFFLELKDWREEKGDDGKLRFIYADLVLRMWDLRSGSWKEYGQEELSVPGWLDKAVFLAEDVKNAAIDKALDSTGLKSEINSAVDAAKDLTGIGSTVKIGNKQKDWYVYKVKQTLTMAGKKLGVKVAKYRDFRLRSPVLARQDDEVGIGVGDSEGVRLNDTFLFSRKGPDDWEGFGRICNVGPGGAEGKKDHSQVEVIADYDCEDNKIQVLEYPVVGILAGLSTGLLPFKHSEVILATGDTVSANPIGMIGLSLDIRWRIPWIPLTEFYQTNRVNFIFDLPVVLMTVDPGFEKRWFWGRFAPLVGIRYTLGIAEVPVIKAGTADEEGMATALAHGLEGYLGFNVFLHPAFTISFQAGWRQYFSKMKSFKLDGVNYEYSDVNGNEWKIDLSGPFALLGVTYEY